MSKLWKEAFYESSTNKTLYRLNLIYNSRNLKYTLPMQSKANSESSNSQGKIINRQPITHAVKGK